MPRLGRPPRLYQPRLRRGSDGRGTGQRCNDGGHSDQDFDPKGWLSATSEVDEALNQWPKGPAWPTWGTLSANSRPSTQPGLNFRRCNLEHNTIMLQTWTTATEAFAKALSVRPETESR